MNDLLDDAAKLQRTADLLTKAADAMKTKRRAEFDNGKINASQVMFNVSEETMLRENATKLYVRAVNHVLKGVDGSQAELETAIRDASRRIKDIANFKKAVKIFVSIAGLAGAILSGQPQAIIGALSGLKTAMDSA